MVGPDGIDDEHRLVVDERNVARPDDGYGARGHERHEGGGPGDRQLSSGGMHAASVTANAPMTEK